MEPIVPQHIVSLEFGQLTIAELIAFFKSTLKFILLFNKSSLDRPTPTAP